MKQRTLQIPKEEARKLLAQQIERFVALEERTIETRDNLERYKRDRLRYTKFNIVMFERMFGQDIDKFWRYELASPPYNADFETQLEFYRDQDCKQLTELHAMHDGLDLMLEGKAGFQEQESNAEVKPSIKWSRAEKIAFYGLLSTVLGALFGLAVVPEFRNAIYWFTSKYRATPIATTESSEARAIPEKTILEKNYELPNGAGTNHFVFHLIANGYDDSIKIEVYDKNSSRIQTVLTNLHVSNLPFNGLPDKFLVVEDMNFDGYEDFRILTNAGGAGVAYIAYLFHSDANKFDLDAKLNDIISWSAALRFDSRRKELRRYSSCGSVLEGITRVYKLDSVEGFVLDRTYVLAGGKDVLVENETTCDSYYN
jgi:hypothetical protein